MMITKIIGEHWSVIMSEIMNQEDADIELISLCKTAINSGMSARLVYYNDILRGAVIDNQILYRIDK